MVVMFRLLLLLLEVRVKLLLSELLVLLKVRVSLEVLLESHLEYVKFVCVYNYLNVNSWVPYLYSFFNHSNFILCSIIPPQIILNVKTHFKL